MKKETIILVKVFALLGALSILALIPYEFKQKIYLDTILLIVVGTVLLYVSLTKIVAVSKVSSWKTTKGKVLYKKVKCDNPHAREMIRSYYPYLKSHVTPKLKYAKI